MEFEQRTMMHTTPASERVNKILDSVFGTAPMTVAERAAAVGAAWQPVPSEVKEYVEKMVKTSEKQETAAEYWYTLTMQEQLELSFLYLDDTKAAREWKPPAPEVPEPVFSPYKPGPDASTGKSAKPHDLEHGALVSLPARCLSFQ